MPFIDISKIERGVHDPNVDSLCLIGAALGVDGWRLLRFAQRKAREQREVTL